jgi:Tfp pilus tip-associated adhesin PilY1
VSQPTGGTATVVGNKITYVASNCPTTANDSFTYTIRDAAGLTATATVNVTKFDATPPPPPAPNTAPIATDDQVTTSPGVPVTIMVLMNDSDLDKDTLMIESFQQGRFGSVRQEGDKLIYTPGPQFNRAGDFFNYTIKDGKGGTATAQVRIICV